MRSDTVKKGVQQAPHRSLFNALGMTQEELDRPLIGVVSSYNEIVPGHMNLDKITEAVKMGVAMAGGTPIMVPAIAVCDGIAMGHIGMKYSLVTRDLIADSTEALAMAHQFDGLVMIPNCDKNVPGLLMAAASTPALTKEQWVEIQTKVTKGGANIIALRGRSSFQSPAYVSIEMIAAAMGGKPFRWPAGTYVHSHGFDHIMMAMETEITKDGVHYKELNGTPEEEAKLKESYAHLCTLRDEVIEMGVLPAIKDWHSINPNID